MRALAVGPGGRARPSGGREGQIGGSSAKPSPPPLLAAGGLLPPILVVDPEVLVVEG